MTDVSIPAIPHDQADKELVADTIADLNALLDEATERFQLKRESNDLWFPKVVGGLSRRGNHPGAEIRLHLLLLAAQWADIQDRLEEGAFAAARAAEIAGELGNISLHRRALNLLGVFQLRQRDFSEAMVAFAQALKLADKDDDPLGKCAVLANVAAARLEAGFLADTIKLNEYVLFLCGTKSSPLFQSIRVQAHHNICLAALYYSDVELAERHMNAALEVLQEPQDFFWAAQRGVVDLTCTRIYLELGDLNEAKRSAAHLTALAARLQCARTSAGAILASALCEAAEGNTERAITAVNDLEERQSHMLPIMRDILDAKERCYRYAGARGYSRYYREKHLADLATFQRKSANAQVSSIKRWLEARPTSKRYLDSTDLGDSLLSRLESLAVMAELREDAMGEHAFRVGRLASLLAISVGKSAEQARSLELAARLHDIGKLGLPDAILMKRTTLSEAEIELVHRHTLEGCQMLTDVLSRAELVCNSGELDILRMASEIALHHHERWDGTGYPRQLSGEQIPECARITAICDAFDKLTRARPYKKAVTARQAMEIMKRAGGTQFDPTLLVEFEALAETLSEQRFMSDVTQEVEASPFIAANQLIDSIVAAGEPSSS